MAAIIIRLILLTKRNFKKVITADLPKVDSLGLPRMMVLLPNLVARGRSALVLLPLRNCHHPHHVALHVISDLETCLETALVDIDPMRMILVVLKLLTRTLL